MTRSIGCASPPRVVHVKARPSVLIVDDDNALLDCLESAIGPLGYAVTTVSDGLEALREFRKSHPRIVLVDLIMPDMDGIEIIRAIRRERSDTLIIAMSGGGRIIKTEYLGMAEKLGADASLEKPFSADSFHHIAMSLMRRERASRGRRQGHLIC